MQIRAFVCHVEQPTADDTKYRSDPIFPREREGEVGAVL